MKSIKERFQNWEKGAAALLIGLFLTTVVIFAYNSNKGPLQASASVTNIQDTTKLVNLSRFDQTYTTVMPFFQDSLNLVYKECEQAKIQVVVENDSLVVLNKLTARPVISGKIYIISPDRLTLVGLASNFIGDKVPFTLTRLLPYGGDPKDPTSLILLLHINDKSATYFILSQKKTCGELKAYLKVQ